MDSLAPPHQIPPERDIHETWWDFMLFLDSQICQQVLFLIKNIFSAISPIDLKTGCVHWGDTNLNAHSEKFIHFWVPQSWEFGVCMSDYMFPFRVTAQRSQEDAEEVERERRRRSREKEKGEGSPNWLEPQQHEDLADDIEWVRQCRHGHHISHHLSEVSPYFIQSWMFNLDAISFSFTFFLHHDKSLFFSPLDEINPKFCLSQPSVPCPLSNACHPLLLKALYSFL